MSGKKAADKAAPEAADVAASEPAAQVETPAEAAPVTMADVDAAIAKAFAEATKRSAAQVEMLRSHMGQLRENFMSSLEQVAARVDSLSAGAATPASMAGELDAIRAILGRIGKALNRQDLLTPPASAEQVEAALKAGCTLQVLQPYKAMGIAFEAGRRLESTAFDHRSILDGVRSGRLLVSIVKD